MDVSEEVTFLNFECNELKKNWSIQLIMSISIIQMVLILVDVSL